jgi:hypothetical protein
MSEPKIKAHVPVVWNVAKIEETDGVLPSEDYQPPTVWVEMHRFDSDRVRRLTGYPEPAALIFEQEPGKPERLIGFLRREDMVHLYRFFNLGDV